MKLALNSLVAIVALLTACVSPSLGATVLFEDNFDSYANGLNLQGVNGWKGWDNTPGASATVSNLFSSSAPNAVAAAPASDLVRQFTTSGTGVYQFNIDTYIPSGSTGTQFFILLNTYNDNGPYNWSLQQTFNNATGMVSNADGHGISTAIIYDQWVPVNVVVDMDADTQSLAYGGVELFAGVSWTNGASGGGALDIGAVDLFGNNASVMYYDNVYLAQVPEPGMCPLLVVGAVSAMARRRKKC